MPARKIFGEHYPDLLKEWDYEENEKLGIDPFKIGSSFKGKVHWIGADCGHHFQAWISTRIKGTGCSYCSPGTSAVLEGFNDLATEHPDLAAQWHRTKNGSLKPTQVRSSSGRKVWWLGECGCEWEANINNRVRGAGCRYCTPVGRKFLKVGMNDLASQDPGLAAQWHPTMNGELRPEDVTAKSHTRVFWQCIRDPSHYWEATVKDRVAGYGCPVCVNQKVIPGINDLATVSPELAQQWHPDNDVSPTEVSAGSKTVVKWICLRDRTHSWFASCNDRQRFGCPYCSGNKILVGYNDLATTHTEIAAEWIQEKNGETTPEQVSKGTMAYYWWRCPEGHEYRMRPNSRTTGRGCPKCYQPWSKAEKQVLGFLVELLPGVDVLNNDRSLFGTSGKRMELDIYIPSLSLGVEFNGEYWHDEELFPEVAERHRRKQAVCDEKGVKLVVVWESAWNDRQDEVETQLRKIVAGGSIPGWLTYERE